MAKQPVTQVFAYNIGRTIATPGRINPTFWSNNHNSRSDKPNWKSDNTNPQSKKPNSVG